MDLPTYTNIWRIEKRLYKLYDLRLPMPLPLVQIGVFVGVFVPWVLLLVLIGVPLETPWHVLYLVPPGVLTWLATRPVIEGKRLTELLLSQARYLAEPRTWCRLTPIREPREVVIVARVWRRRADLPAPATAPARAAVRAHRKERGHTAPATAPARAAVRAHRKERGHAAVVPIPASSAAAAQAGSPAVAGPTASPGHTLATDVRVAGAPGRRAAKPWRRTTPRSISHEADAPPSPPRAPEPSVPASSAVPPAARPADPAELERPPATPRLEVPPARRPGSGKRALASGIKRPGEATEFWGTADPSTERATTPQPARPETQPGHSEGADVPPGRAAQPPGGEPASTGRPAPAAHQPSGTSPTEHPSARPDTFPTQARASEETSAQSSSSTPGRAPAAPTGTSPQNTGTTGPTRPAPATTPDVPQRPPSAQPPDTGARATTDPSRAEAAQAGTSAAATTPDIPQQSPDTSRRVPEGAEPTHPRTVEFRAGEGEQAGPVRPARPTAPDIPQQSPEVPRQVPQGAEPPADSGTVASEAGEDERAGRGTDVRPAPATAPDIPQQPVEAASASDRHRPAEEEGAEGGAAEAREAAPTAVDIPVQEASGDLAEEATAVEGESAGQTAPGERAPEATAAESSDEREPADGTPAPATRPDIRQTTSGTTVPDIPRVPEAFGAAGRDDRAEPEDTGVAADEDAGPPGRIAASAETPSDDAEETGPSRTHGPTKPWRDGLSRPLRAATTDALVWPPVPAAGSGPTWRRERGQERSGAETTGAPPDAGRVREPHPAAPPGQVPDMPAAQGGTAATPPGGLPPAGPPPAGQTPTGPPLPDTPPAGPPPTGYAPAGGPHGGRRPAGPPPVAPAPWPPAGYPSEARPEPAGRPEPGRQQPADEPVRPAGPPFRGRTAGRPGDPARPPQGMPFGPPPRSEPRPSEPPADQRVAGPDGGRPGREAAAQTPPPAPAREVRSGPASPVRPRPLPPPPPPPPSTPAITPPDPEQETAPSGGLRRLIAAVGGGHSQLDEEYEERLQRPFQGSRHIVVLGCTGGAGQTVTALMLGHTFAQYCGEPVVAVDINPGPGALARRSRSDTHETLTGLITRADQVTTLTAMRRYTSQAKSGLDVIAAGKNPLQALDDRDYALAVRTIDRFYSITLLDAAAAVVARVLPHADQIVLVAPASADAPRAVAMTFEWLDGHGYDGLRSRAVTVINGVSRRSMDDVEQAEAVARGRCRALVRIPWDDHLSMDRAPRNELKSLRSPTRRAYLALAGVVAGGFAELPERYVQQEDVERQREGTR